VEIAIGVLFGVIGVWSVCGAALNLNVFVNHPKARTVAAGLGPIGARLFFIILGACMIALGVFVAVAA